MDRQCTIEDFRKLVDDMHNTIGIDKKLFMLYEIISGDMAISNTYKLEIFDGESWTKLFEDYDLCTILTQLRQVMYDVQKA